MCLKPPFVLKHRVDTLHLRRCWCQYSDFRTVRIKKKSFVAPFFELLRFLTVCFGTRSWLVCLSGWEPPLDPCGPARWGIFVAQSSSPAGWAGGRWRLSVLCEVFLCASADCLCCWRSHGPLLPLSLYRHSNVRDFCFSEGKSSGLSEQLSSFICSVGFIQLSNMGWPPNQCALTRAANGSQLKKEKQIAIDFTIIIIIIIVIRILFLPKTRNQ